VLTVGQVFFASYLIGLREGLEMVLIVSVLVAYLVKTGRRQHLLPVWGGVAAAAVLSIGFGWALSYVSTTVLGGPGQELFDAITSTVAVALVTWMVFWMRRTARRISGELRGRLDDAIGLGIGAVVGIAFLAVVREGLETTLLFFASAQGATTAAPLLGLAGGLLTSVVAGVALYLGAIRINLSKFFTVSGVLLVLVAAGIFKYAVHDFQEAGVLPGLTTHAFELVRRAGRRAVQHHSPADRAGDDRLGRLPGARADPLPAPRARRPDHPGCRRRGAAGSRRHHGDPRACRCARVTAPPWPASPP
jgi:high-affinity iron transporter